MKAETIDAFKAHAVEAYPSECCGLFAVIKGKERYLPCRNIAETAHEHFVLNPEDYAKAEELGEVIGVGHSHPNVNAQPSEADRVSCESSGLPWYIVSVGKNIDDQVEAMEVRNIEPCGYEAPLVGRMFSHGVLDCYTLVQDWYKRERGIELPFFERRDDWWLKGDNLYMENYKACGFEPIRGEMQVGDIILMQIRADVPNHAAVYVGDGLILHHFHGRMSSRDVYDGYWQENTRVIIRKVN